MASKQVIYRNWNTGLGDTIATLSLLDHLQRRQHTPVYLSTQQHGFDLRPKQEEIMSLMLTYPGEPGIELVDDEPNTDLDGYAVWAAIPFRTKLQWRFEARRNLVTYHFTGLSSAADKNLPMNEQQEIIDWIRAKGLVPCMLDPQLPLSRYVSLLANSMLFCGVDSGPAHLAHAVQVVPTYILEYRLPIVTCHRGKQYIKCTNAGHFIAQAENYLAFLRFIGGGLT
jgi:Glycosyltransferase family 9 (heptosyltransferase)